MAKKKAGSLHWEETIAGDELVLTFKKNTPETSLLSLGLYIESALRTAAEAPQRREKERLEREGEGVDPIVLSKVRREIDKVLARFDNRTINAEKTAAAAVRSFKNGDRVQISKAIAELGGKEAGVVGIKKKYLIIEVGGKRYRVTPSQVTKVEAVAAKG